MVIRHTPVQPNLYFYLFFFIVLLNVLNITLDVFRVLWSQVPLKRYTTSVRIFKHLQSIEDYTSI